MNYRQLGSSDLQVSVIGIGTMSWPYCNYGETPPARPVIDYAAIRQIVATAIDAGINVFDTAEGYGRGLGETLLGDALHTLGKRSRVHIVTKVGPLFGQEQIDGRAVNLRAKHIYERCDNSLKRLQTDYIDLYLAHRPDALTPIEETVGAMQTLQERGKIRYFGVSNFDRAQLAEALQYGPVTADQLPYNLIQREIDAELRPFCQERQVGIMAYTPLGKGILAGKYDEDHLPPAEDYRHQRPYFAKDNLSKHFALTRHCRELSTQLGITVSQFALAWCLAQPGVTIALPGAKNPEQVKDSAKAGEVVIPPEILQQIP
jgi:aryl-alcohol dehydrogenase-like predicted oxidoreductase